MADHPRFGPAGVPPMFRLMGAKLQDVPKLLRTEGLDAFEYGAVRWGQVPQIKREDAENLAAEAKRNDVSISLHGSYFINLTGEAKVMEASKQRLIACTTAAEWMSAYVVVFHTGFYGRTAKAEAYRKTVGALKEVIKTMEGSGLEKVKLGPETMGRHSQFGTIDEILDLCQEVERTQLVIDWSHLHARSGGGLQSVEAFRKIVEKAEEKLGMETVRNMHCHFSKIEYTYKTGEKRHHTLDEPAYGPDFAMLAEVIAEFKLRPVIICETPVLDIDAMKMRDTLQKITKNQNNPTA
jgi:deoxyribonuclease-4